MKSIRPLAIVGLVAVLSLSCGCLTTLTPKTADLQRVHELYADEFTTLESPPPHDLLATSSPASGAAFAQSLRAIHEYRLKHPADSPELAHLKVLEGMIHLQSGRFGLAAAMKDDIRAAETALTSARGTSVRDQLFARNFATLLEGWSETRKENNRRWQTFERVADELASAVQQVPAAQRANVETDQGALYLATSSAIFYVWAGNQIALSSDRALAPARKKEWYQKGRDAIGLFLTDAEKNADVSQDIGSAPQGRLRHLQWYHWLNQELRSLSA